MASSSQLRHFGALANERDVTILEAAVDGRLKRGPEPAAAKASAQEPADRADAGEASDGEDVLGLRAETAKEEVEEPEVASGMEVDAEVAADVGEAGEGSEAVSGEKEAGLKEKSVETPTATLDGRASGDDGVDVKLEEAVEDVEAEEEVEERGARVDTPVSEGGKPPRPATPELPVSGKLRSG